MKKPFNRLINQNEHGYSLLIAIFALALFSILGMGILTISANTLKTSTNERVDQSVYYIAEGALVETKKKLLNDIEGTLKNSTEIANLKEDFIDGKIDLDTFYTEINDIFFIKIQNEIIPKYNGLIKDFEDSFGNETFADINVIGTLSIEPTTNKEILTIQINSEGNIDNKQRNVSQKITIPGLNVKKEEESKEIEVTTIETVVVGQKKIVTKKEIIEPIKIPFTIQALDSFSTGNGANTSIEGCVVFSKNTTVSDQKNKAEKCPSNINGLNFADLNYPKPSNEDMNDWQSEYSSGAKLVLENNLNIPTLNSPSKDFEINVGDKNIIIVVDKLDFSNIENFKVVGNGSLSIYVNSEVIFNKQSTIGNVNKFNLFYYGEKNISFPNHLSFKGNMYVSQTNISVNAGTNFEGNIIAPNSTVNLNLGNKEVLAGSVIAKNVNAQGGHISQVPNNTIGVSKTEEFIEYIDILEEKKTTETKNVVEIVDIIVDVDVSILKPIEQ